MKNEEMSFLIRIGYSKEKAEEIYNNFQEMYKILQKVGYKLS